MTYIFVLVPPVIIDNMTSTDMVVREGTNVTMVCRATGYPEPYVMWRREDGQEFNCNGESGKISITYFTIILLCILALLPRSSIKLLVRSNSFGS